MKVTTRGMYEQEKNDNKDIKIIDTHKDEGDEMQARNI